MRVRSLLAAAVVAAVTLSPVIAKAGGLYITDRGVRPLGRGGAFVAGADDLGAIVYNPAGIYDAGSAIFVDASWVGFQADYTRQALLRQIDPNTGEVVATYEQTFPTVESSQPFLAIPTLVGSFSPHPDWMLAFGAWVPYAATPTYGSEIDGKPAPQRYSLVSLEGTVLAVLGGWAAWAPTDELRLGVGVELMVGAFSTQVAMSGCLPERFFCAPEDPEWDVMSQLDAGPIFSPSFNLGAIWRFAENFRLGASYQFPFFVRAPATVTTRLPTTAVFDESEQVGEDATISFTLPMQFRLGVEMRDLPKGLRIELAGQYDHWAMHDSISLDPTDIALTNLPGFPKEYYVPEIELPREFQGTGSVKLGAEYDIPASETVTITPRVGASFESSAVPADYLSVLTIDSNKVTPAVGVSVTIDAFRIEAVYAHVFAESVTVAPEDAKIEQVVPLLANPAKYPDTINGGVYNWSANVVGLGASYTFGAAKPKGRLPEEDPEVPAPKPTPPKEPAKASAEEGEG